MFLDEVKFEIRSGNGGPGCVSFHREKYMPKGGPDGGNGGRGGNVVVEVDPSLNTLWALKFKNEYVAKNGLPGMGSNRTGKSGEDLILKVPPGTIIKDAENDSTIVDLSDEIKHWTLLDGGRGGLGNAHYKSSIKQTPRISQTGEKGQTLKLALTLKLIADVGLLGMPNAGKSSFLSRISKARPEVANYPFTTLTPHLGVHVFDQKSQLVVADIPGLIEGASEGKGLGHQFLRHVERTRILLHLVEPFAYDELTPPQRIKVLNKELQQYSDTLASKKQIPVLTKMDLNPDPKEIQAWEEELGEPFITISTVTGQGCNQLMNRVRHALEELDQEQED